MSDRYQPASDFLRSIIAEEVPLSGSKMADENMRLLIRMTGDDDRSNRDWATMLLAQEEADTPEIRAALLRAASDEDNVVRAEALLGIAKRDPQQALPLALVALSGDQVNMAVFEAAEIIANPQLIDSLHPWTEPSDDPQLDRLAMDAMKACGG
jgi:HEAT repeat protein